MRSASRSSANRGVVNEDSGLADFLISRSVNNPILGNRFHWYLMVELENKETAKTYGRVSYKFMTRLMEVRTSSSRRSRERLMRTNRLKTEELVEI